MPFLTEEQAKALMTKVLSYSKADECEVISVTATTVISVMRGMRIYFRRHRPVVAGGIIGFGKKLALLPSTSSTMLR
ncbi:MAG: hypothetical protein QM664_03245 [Flavihumibacter sp.]